MDQRQEREMPDDLIHVEGIMDTGEYVTYDVENPETCHMVRAALGFFDPIPIRSGCVRGCNGCGFNARCQLIPFES